MILRGLILGTALTLVPAGAAAQTLFTQPEPCRIKITVRIEIHHVPVGSLPVRRDDAGNEIVPDYATGDEVASAELAAAMERRIEATWNGPTAEEATTLAGTTNVDARSDDYSRDVIREAGDLRTEWNRYATEFGVDQTCAWVPCCPMEIDADVRYRAHDATPTPGYHQIGIMAPAHRSFVYYGRNPDLPDDVPTDWSNPAHKVRGDRVQTSGRWANRGDAQRAPEAHEVGHLMGLPDQYTDAGGTAEGHHHDVMASNHGFPFGDALEALRARSGFNCEDCCPARDELTAIMTDYNLVVGDTGDMIAVCDQEAILRQLNRLRELRRRLVLSNAAPRQKAIAAAEIDAQIRRFERALVDCPRDRVVTGGDPPPAVTTGGNFTPIPADTSGDSTEWCTYREGTSIPGTLIPGTPGDDPGDVTPPTGPATTPGDGGDDGDDPRDTPTPPGSTPGGDDDGDDPRDTPTPGSTPGSTPEGDDGDDPRDIPIPTLPGGSTTPDDDDPSDTPTEDDGDDPRDTPPVTVHVKARTSVMEGGTQSSEVGGQTIRLLTPETTNPALPLDGNTRNDEAYDEEPLQCQTDANGDCQIMVDAGTMYGLGLSALGTADFALASDYTMEVETPDRESVILTTDAPLSQEDIDNLTGAAVEGDEIEVTGLRLSAGLSYRLDYGLRAGYSWDEYIDVNIDYAEDNVCRDKQPGPPLGWTPAHLTRLPARPGDDLPRQSLVLPGIDLTAPAEGQP